MLCGWRFWCKIFFGNWCEWWRIVINCLVIVSMLSYLGILYFDIVEERFFLGIKFIIVVVGIFVVILYVIIFLIFWLFNIFIDVILCWNFWSFFVLFWMDLWRIFIVIFCFFGFFVLKICLNVFLLIFLIKWYLKRVFWFVLGWIYYVWWIVVLYVL